MEKNKKENTNNLISRIKARANADKNTEEKKSPDSLILRIKTYWQLLIKIKKDKLQFSN